MIDLEEFILGVKQTSNYHNMNIREIEHIYNALTNNGKNGLSLSGFSSALLYWNDECNHIFQDCCSQDCCIKFIFD